MTEQYVLDLQDVDETRMAVVGGKAAHLGGLSRIEGIRVHAMVVNPVDLVVRRAVQGRMGTQDTYRKP